MLATLVRDGYDLPALTLESVRAKANLKTQKQIRLATVGCNFRVSLAHRKLADQRSEPHAPGLLFGLEQARKLNEQQLAKLVGQELPARLAATVGASLPDEVLERVHNAVRTICEHSLWEL